MRELPLLWCLLIKWGSLFFSGNLTLWCNSYISFQLRWWLPKIMNLEEFGFCRSPSLPKKTKSSMLHYWYQFFLHCSLAMGISDAASYNLDSRKPSWFSWSHWQKFQWHFQLQYYNWLIRTFLCCWKGRQKSLYFPCDDKTGQLYEIC